MTSFRPVFLNNRRESSDTVVETVVELTVVELVILLCAMSHVVLIVLRGVGVITWPWWIVLIPELFVTAGIVELMMFVLLSAFQDRRKGRSANGE